MYKIVIIDDDVDVPNSLANYFPWEENGFKVVEKFYSAGSALDFLANHPVDVVLSDIYMPEMTGIQLIKALKDLNRDEQVILLSGYKDFEYAKAAMSYGVKYYLLKPATYSEIVQVLTDVKSDLEKRHKGYGVFQHGRHREPGGFSDGGHKEPGNFSDGGHKEPGDVSDNRYREPGALSHTLHASAGISFNAKMIQKIKAYIDQHCDQACLDTLSDHMNMNKSYLSRFFKEHTGENITVYRTRIRMQKAVLLLTDVQFKNIYTISALLGYDNPKSFTKVFKKAYGVTPQEYRNKFGGT